MAVGAVPLMQRALDRCRELAASGDRVAERLAPFLEHHIPEETGHDEWLLDDIAALGGDPAAVRARVPSASAAAINGAQPRWIEHAHPVALLGTPRCSSARLPSWACAGTSSSGGPGFRGPRADVRCHAVIDLRHRDEIHACLNGAVLDVEQESLVGMSALHTAGMVVHLHGEVRAPTSSGQR